MADTIKTSVASAVATALIKAELVSWKHETTRIDNLTIQIKVWTNENGPPRYFMVKVSEPF